MELSPRLLAVAQWVPRGARFADVGTDHAHLPVWLLQHGVIDHAIAADLRAGPLKNARENAAMCGLSDRIDLRLCSGLSAIGPDEADVIAIAGMGGENIIEILRAAPWTRASGHLFLLQPMTALPELRLWLTENGFDLNREKTICEGEKLYTIISASAGKGKNLSLAEQWVGRQQTPADDPLRGRRLDDQLRRTLRARDGLAHSQQADGEKLAQFDALADGLRRMKEEWDAWQR